MKRTVLAGTLVEAQRVTHDMHGSQSGRHDQGFRYGCTWSPEATRDGAANCFALDDLFPGIEMPM